MKFLSFKKNLVLVFLFLWIFVEVVVALPSEENSNPTNCEGQKVRLVIFWPAEITVKILSELRKQGLLHINDLEVIGVYHEKELTDFNRAKKYVHENNIDWFEFRELKGELSIDTIFQENGCTADFRDIIENSDGVIFFGGNDIQPQIYGQKTSILTDIQTPYRHLLALSATFHFLGGFQDKDHAALLESQPEFPVLGICLGCQTLNVGTGGTMIQDI